MMYSGLIHPSALIPHPFRGFSSAPVSITLQGADSPDEISISILNAGASTRMNRRALAFSILVILSLTSFLTARQRVRLLTAIGSVPAHAAARAAASVP